MDLLRGYKWQEVEEEIQTLVNDYSTEVYKHIEVKEKEIMTVKPTNLLKSAGFLFKSLKMETHLSR